VSFPPSKEKKGLKVEVEKKDIKDNLKKLQGPQHEQNKNMGIFKNPFTYFMKAKMKDSTVNFASGFHPM